MDASSGLWGGSREPLGLLLGPLGRVLAASWGDLGASWSGLGASWGGLVGYVAASSSSKQIRVDFRPILRSKRGSQRDQNAIKNDPKLRPKLEMKNGAL